MQLALSWLSLEHSPWPASQFSIQHSQAPVKCDDRDSPAQRWRNMEKPQSPVWPLSQKPPSIEANHSRWMSPWGQDLGFLQLEQITQLIQAAKNWVAKFTMKRSSSPCNSVFSGVFAASSRFRRSATAILNPPTFKRHGLGQLGHVFSMTWIKDDPSGLKSHITSKTYIYIYYIYIYSI